MRVYISGKIGEEVLSEATRQKFARAEELLLARGFDVINPASEKYQEMMDVDFRIRQMPKTYADCILFDLQWLRTCKAIYMLSDFLDSKGAKAEYAFAIAIGLQVYYADELYRDGTLRGKCYDKNRLSEVAP
jgi:hypothetical protein